MRRWIVLVMLFVLPVQFSWAAAASYCQHENDTRRQHVGHHEHQHQPKAKAAKDAATSVSQAEVGVNKLPGLDGDCGYCHLAMAQALPAPAVRLPFLASASPPDMPTAGCVTHLFERIERPNWQRA